MKKLLACYFLFCAALAQAQAPAPYGPLPSPAQLQWHETGMYCIVHYGPDTYTNKEWGYGDEDPAIVNPDAFDAL
ncbi:MAG TPA: glycoside hydrolase family 29, partial [Chitinophaga sp.]